MTWMQEENFFLSFSISPAQKAFKIRTGTQDQSSRSHRIARGKFSLPFLFRSHSSRLHGIISMYICMYIHNISAATGCEFWILNGWGWKMEFESLSGSQSFLFCAWLSLLSVLFNQMRSRPIIMLLSIPNETFREIYRQFTNLIRVCTNRPACIILQRHLYYIPQWTHSSVIA
jgi:hypothetical protein